jgi:hypothetical protein
MATCRNEYTNSLTGCGGISIPGVVSGKGETYTTTTAANRGYDPVGFKGVLRRRFNSGCVRGRRLFLLQNVLQ